MSTTDERILRTMRGMAWHRAKGELRSMLETFWEGTRNDGQLEELDKVMSEFVKKVEDNGLHE